ncbi:MAG: tail-specific protease [Waddliaceae bacterium]|nr:tail-specific protease [Waddliaceae bacterium]
MAQSKKFLVTLSLLFNFLFAGIYAAEAPLLKESDIPQIMKQIFDYHVDEKMVNAEVLRRSFLVYLDHFDPDRMYFTKEEVEKITEHSEGYWENVLQEYQNNDFSSYASLNDMVQKVIERSRKWRLNFVLHAKERLSVPVKLENRDPYEKQEWAESEEELRDRLEQQMVRFVAAQEQKVGKERVQERLIEVLALYERFVRNAENDYLFLNDLGKPIDEDKKKHRLVVHILKSLTKSLDSHTAFFSPQEAYDMKVRLQKGFHGIGIVLQETIDGIMVTRLIKGGPAVKSGLVQEEDRLIEVDGQAIAGYSFEHILDMVRGQESSSVVLGLVRLEDRGTAQEREHFFNVELVRKRIDIDENRVDLSWVPFGDGIIGTIVLHSFYEGANGISSEQDVRAALQKLQTVGKVKGLVLDLRQNMGGFLMQAVKVAGLFISNGVVVVSKYSDGQKRYFRDTDGHTYYDGPLVVLTSRASASAAEIVAQALQDYGAAIIVGDDRTYGKGSIQHQTVTEDGLESYFKVTVGRYYTVSGKSTQITGVVSDIQVPGIFQDKHIGEEFLDFPLSTDKVAPSYQDKLEDLETEAVQWYQRHYVPSLEQVDKHWRAMLPLLRENSEERLAQMNQATSVKEEVSEDEDGQLKEAINIVKDMVHLDITQVPPSDGLNLVEDPQPDLIPEVLEIEK